MFGKKSKFFDIFPKLTSSPLYIFDQNIYSSHFEKIKNTNLHFFNGISFFFILYILIFRKKKEKKIPIIIYLHVRIKLYKLN